MVVEIISVGTEILMGNIVNTNAQYLAKKLAHLGLDCHFQTVVGDNPERIKSALDVAYSRADAVIMTGGLGPTKDDLTKEMLMKYFGKTPVVDEKVLSFLEEHVKKRGFEKLSDGMRKQAIVPADSIILYNHNGTAPGCIMERDGKICILLPGPPHEMKPMFEECCKVYLNGKSDKVFVSVIIKCLSKDEAPITMVGEAPIADRLDELTDGVNPTVATYAKQDGCLVRITASAKNHSDAMRLLTPVVNECRKRIGKGYISYIEEDIN
ncbi:MAG: damage-inducible protein CinA [Selenomonadaceae bacterium]|nr:damage-inducible protein CinA [Selenomonadaceae bacterium]